MRIGSLHKVANSYTEVSVLRKNSHGIWVRGDINPPSAANEFGIKYMRVDVGMIALFVAGYNNSYGVFLVEDQFVELQYTHLDLEELSIIQR